MKRYIIVQAFEERGGIRYIFLSRKDDVADAARYAKTFHATRIIHRADSPAMPSAEWIIDGEDAVQAEPEFVFIPVPGHTAGSVSLLYNNRFLFSGDHLWWDREFQQIGTQERLVWDDAKLEESVRTLLNYSFEWILPGHEERIALHRDDMKDAVEKLIYRRWPLKNSRI
jgi:glyoxylase-like metal-dependent hydrolase (beta-lactamase superfamily II)